MAKGKSSGVVRRKSGCTRPRRPTPRRSVDGSLPWNPIRSQWDPYLNQEDFLEVILTGKSYRIAELKKIVLGCVEFAVVFVNPTHLS